MGHHYVPQEYLRPFEVASAPGTVLTYDKKELSCKQLPIKIVAQAPNFYEADVEAELASRLEGPANIILAELRNLRPISTEQREHFAIYTTTMMKRVPRRRRIARDETAPKAIEKTINELLESIRHWAQTATDQELVKRRFAEVERIRQQFQEELPKEVSDQIDSPWPTVRMIESVASMTWRVAFTRGPQFFITSDNPAFFFEAYGTGNPDSEIAFPLAPNVALMCDRKGAPGATFPVEVKQKIVREVNRRMVASAERLIFAHQPQPWLVNTMKKPRPFLSRIGW